MIQDNLISTSLIRPSKSPVLCKVHIHHFLGLKCGRLMGAIIPPLTEVLVALVTDDIY
jgi:hypothetical protein